jgi:hypothetical protein
VRIPEVLEDQEHWEMIQDLQYHIEKDINDVNEEHDEQEPEVVKRHCWHHH